MMLQTVISNLERTIFGKEQLLNLYLNFPTPETDVVARFIAINLGELRAIEADLRLIDIHFIKE